MSINAGTVYSELVLDMNRYEQGLRQAEQQMNTFATNLGNIGKSMEKAGKAWTTKVTLPIVGLGAAAVKVGSDFESSMSEVAAISGATGAQFEDLEEKAKQMGATTKFSASESAQAMKYMAMAGWDTNQMLDGLEGIMSLAAASGEDLALTSDIVTDALTAFGMQANEAGKFADLLASASSNSNTNVALLGESFKYVAPLFGSVGYSAEDAALALGLMSNAGIKGSQSGTTLRSAITNMIKPTARMEKAINQLGLSVTDASGEMMPFQDVMIQLREKFAGLSEEQKAQYSATIFGKEAMSGMLAIINASDADFAKLTDSTRNYNGTAKEMAEIMEDNLQGNLTKLKSALEGVGIQIFEILLPHLEKAIAKFQEWTDKFASLDKETQETILKMAGLAAAIGPVLLIGGKLATSVSTITGLFSTFTGATATAAGAGGLGALGTGFGATLTAMAPWALGIAGAGVVAYELYKELNERTIPTVELFGDSVSESTKEAVGSFLELNDKATLSLNQLNWSGQSVTQEMASGITDTFSSMKDQIIQSLDEQHVESYNKMKTHFENSLALTEQEEANILQKIENSNEAKEIVIENSNARINEIMQRASEERRTLTKEEQEEINRLQIEMKETGIKTLSETELESKAILERMRAQAGEITAQQAVDVVKNSLEQKEKAIKAAEEQYNSVVKEIIKQRDELGIITKEQADKLIQEAKRQKDEVTREANTMHHNVVFEAQQQAKEHVEQIDWESGEIISKWDKLKKWFSENPIIRKIFTVSDGQKSEANDRVNPLGSIGNNAHGTNYWKGGLTWVGEQGPEIIDLPQGSKVYSNQKSMEMAKGSSGGITQNINIYSPTPLSPSETARKSLQASRQLAMEWGV